MHHRCAVAVRADFNGVRCDFGRGGADQVETAASGEKHPEAGGAICAIAKAAERDAAVVFLDNTSADPEAKASSFRGFCAEERLEELPRVLRIDAHPSVNDRDCNSSPAKRPIVGIPHGDAKIAATWHCLNRIADQVEEYLAQLNGEAVHHAGREVTLAQLDMAVEDLALLETENVIEQFGECDSDGGLGFTIEAEGLPCDVRDAL